MASFRDTQPKRQLYQDAPQRPQPETALPIGMHVVIHLHEPIGDLKWIDGRVVYCSTYGIRLRAADGSEIYTPHTNVVGAVGGAR